MKRGNDSHKAACILCNNSAIDITKMSVSALVSHAAGTKHKERLRTYNPISSLCLMNKNVNKDTPKVTSTPFFNLFSYSITCWNLLGYESALVTPSISFMFKFKWTFLENVPRQSSCKVISAFKNKMCLLCCFWFSTIS